jgi:hypothetical protein
MKIPRKAELVRLQELYKTDIKIAEALGGIPEYLVAYWRRKKGIPRHSAAKFSRQQVVELWERYGDDFRGGRELNISKAAFYSWRRKYGVTERPAVLKLEQLELHLGEASQSESGGAGSDARTASAKIFRLCRERWPDASQPIDWQIKQNPDAQDRRYAVSPGPVFEWPSDGKPGPAPLTEDTESGDTGFWCHPEQGAIPWQLIETRRIRPGQLVTGSKDLLGGLGGIGTLVVEEGTGQAGGHVVKIEITRRLSGQTDVEDLLLYFLSHGWNHDWLDGIVEFWGGPIERLTPDRKVKLCALTTAFGAAAALTPFDDMIRRHYGRHLHGQFPRSHPDRTAIYDGEHFLEGRHVDAAIGRWDDENVFESCAPDTVSCEGVIIGPAALPYEIETAAAIAQERMIDRRGGALIVCPATARVHRLAHRRGWAQTIIDAGGTLLDLNLLCRLRPTDLVGLATSAESGKPVIATHPILKQPDAHAAPVVFGSVQTAMARGLRWL